MLFEHTFKMSSLLYCRKRIVLDVNTNMPHEDCFAYQCILRNSFPSDTKFHQVHVSDVTQTHKHPM